MWTMSAPLLGKHSEDVIPTCGFMLGVKRHTQPPSATHRKKLPAGLITEKSLLCRKELVRKPHKSN